MLAPFIVSALLAAAGQSPQDVLADVRVQGNVMTPDDEIRRLAGVTIGMPVAAGTPDDVAERLRRTKRFQRVEVLKRFASISDPTQVLLVIIVDEGPVDVKLTGDPDHPTRVVKNHSPNLLFLPVLNYEDGYGFTYGARLAVPDPVGARSRLTFPLTLGANKEAAVTFEKQLDSGPLTRIEAGATINQRPQPHYDEPEDRYGWSVRGERAFKPWLRVGGAGGWDHVSLLGSDDTYGQAGLDVTLDTRLDPFLPRNAVFARASWTWVTPASTGSTYQTALEGRGYIALVGQSVLVLRAQRQDAGKTLPPYLQPMLGGLENLRGFRTGEFIGDTLVAGSAELRQPLNSPLDFAKIGVRAFADVGAVYAKGQRLADQTWQQGYGGGVWVTAAFLRLTFDVAHGVNASTRVHFSAAASF